MMSVSVPRNLIDDLRARWTLLCSEPPTWFLAFSQLYLSALLLHYGKRWNEPDITVALLFLILWAAIKPRRIEPIIIAQFLVLDTTIVDYPRIANHAAVQMFVALFVIALAGAAFFRRRVFPYQHVASALRGAAVVVYFYVGFHKLNTGFLNPETSCANWYHAKLFRSTFNYDGPIEELLPPIVYGWSPWFVVAAELVTFALLLHRRTRLFGLCTALPVHLYVSLSGFVDFSSMMHSILFLFLPIALADSPRFQRALSGYRIVAVGIAVVTFYMTSEWSSSVGAVRTFQGVVYDLSVLALVAVAVVALRRTGAHRAAGSGGETKEGGGGSRVRWQYAVFPAMLFVWGAFPYLGVSTYGSLTMFSNVVTAPDYDNHVVIDTETTDLFGLQRDLVQVIDMEQELAGKFRHNPIGELVTRSEIGYQVMRTMREHDEPLMAFLLEEGEPTFYEDLRGSDYAEWPLGTRWLFFREIDPVGEARCRW